MKIKPVGYSKIKSVHFVAAITMFWGLSDSLISFYIPIQMQNFLHNLALFGVLFALSSLAGALIDPLLGFLSNRIRYTVLLILGLILSIVVIVSANLPFSLPLIVWLMVTMRILL